jgi:hypothetical protein
MSTLVAPRKPLTPDELEEKRRQYRLAMTRAYRSYDGEMPLWETTLDDFRRGNDRLVLALEEC